MGAVSLNGRLVQWSTLGAIDGLTFEAFIAQTLVSTLWLGAVVIMDNCSIHRNNQELEALITVARAQIIYRVDVSTIAIFTVGWVRRSHNALEKHGFTGFSSRSRLSHPVLAWASW